ncbi:hypothetical protein [Flavicella sediminum]|uniref:hypothetical protein n=1 Tax=Flavicella sediminum TaxID=2585141 RepID=UPI0011203BEC|nr:hypothetical protein [Flavicella sediminum]
MKHISFFSVVFFIAFGSANLHAQFDNPQTSIKNSNFSKLNVAPSDTGGLKQIDFINPEQEEKKYKKNLEKAINDQLKAQELADLKEKGVLTAAQLFEKRLKQEQAGNNRQLAAIDKNLGVLESDTEYVTIICKDFGNEDGDKIRLNANDVPAVNNIYLTRQYQTFKIHLKVGENNIEFLALNEGLYSPNTAGFMIFDDAGKVLLQNDWFLATNAKAYFNIIRIAK